MSKYRKLPVEIEAFQWKPIEITEKNPIPIWLEEARKKDIVCIVYGGSRTYLEIKTLEGVMRANPGDYIIKGVNGELYPCKPDIFKKTYELVES